MSGRHPNPHRVVRGAENLDLADAGDARELILDIDRGVVGEEGLIPGPMRRRNREDQQRKSDRLLGREAVVAHRGGQAGERLRQPVLNLHLVEIDVGADLEVDLQRHRAVVAVDRLHVDHVLRAVDLLLDRSGDRLFDGERVRAGVDRRGLDLGRHDLGKLRDREPEDHHGAGDHKKNGHDHRHDWPVDEEPRHRYWPWRAGLAEAAGRCGWRHGRLRRCRSGRVVWLGGRQPRLHFHPVGDPLQTLGDDPFAGLQPVFDDSEIAGLLAGLDRAQADAVVGIHDRDLILTLGLQHRGLGNQ